jgi:hypothetical protein
VNPTIKIDNVILNENAYFYKKKRIRNKVISKNAIIELFRNVSRNRRIGHYALNKIKEPFINNLGDLAYYSICVFKFVDHPSFLNKQINGIVEIKYAYLLIIEYKDFVVISKRNITGITKWIGRRLEKIDYSIMSRMFVSERSSFEKFTMRNFDVSDSAVRSKTIEADNIQSSMSGFGINRYIVDGMRISDRNNSHHLAFSTSRINRLGGKVYVEKLVNWTMEVCRKIEGFTHSKSYLDRFATPIDVESNINRSDPISILILWSDLYKEIEDGKIISIEAKRGRGDDREWTDLPIEVFVQLIKRFSKAFEVTISNPDSGKRSFPIDTIADKHARLKINKKSITILSEGLRRFRFLFEEGGHKSLLGYLNQKNCFIVNYSEPQLVYFAKKLFEDNRLLNSIEDLESIFIPCQFLETTNSEKGACMIDSTKFQEGSIFHVIEHKLVDPNDLLICDDLGDEWADFIAVGFDTITFFHAKHSEGRVLSASKCQDVIGQALKNIGNINPVEDRWTTKIRKWNQTFNLNKVKTKIKRNRKGNGPTEFVNQYKKRLSSANVRIKVNLVVDYLSKDMVMREFRNLRDGRKVSNRSQVIQLLWFITSYVANCKEVGIEAYITTQR